MPIVEFTEKWTMRGKHSKEGRKEGSKEGREEGRKKGRKEQSERNNLSDSFHSGFTNDGASERGAFFAATNHP